MRQKRAQKKKMKVGGVIRVRIPIPNRPSKIIAPKRGKGAYVRQRMRNFDMQGG